MLGCVKKTEIKNGVGIWHHLGQKMHLAEIFCWLPNAGNHSSSRLWSIVCQNIPREGKWTMLELEKTCIIWSLMSMAACNRWWWQYHLRSTAVIWQVLLLLICLKMVLGLFVCLFRMGLGSWNPVMGHPIFQGFSLKPKRLALVTSLFQALPTYIEPGNGERQTNIPNS